jgi:hypothetical protein
MQTTTVGAHWRRLSSIAALLILASQVVRSQNNTGEIVVPQQHPTGHVHDHGDQTWPPQPEGITGVVDLSTPASEQARRSKLQQRFNELEQRGAAHADFQKALGQRYTRIAIVDNEDKVGTPRGSRFTYFSRDKNATAEVLFDGANIKSVKSIPAREYQPEITDEEISEATELARKYFSSLGIERVRDLKGYGILAYRPEGKGFYDGRVIYVSFHANDDAPPEFMAWVDLTSQTILNSREER